MHTVADWRQTAFAEWLSGRLYVDGRGNYRARVLSRPRGIVGYIRPLNRAYPHDRDFHRAANRRLRLWEVILTATNRANRVPFIKAAAVQSGAEWTAALSAFARHGDSHGTHTK